LLKWKQSEMGIEVVTTEVASNTTQCSS